MGRSEAIAVDRSPIDEVRAAGDFFLGLRGFLGPRLRLEQARARLEAQMSAREEIFSDLLRRAVFERPASPYRRLFEWAGVTFGDVVTLLREDGLDATLERLHDAGVHVTLEEFKARRPLVRPGLEVPLRPADFDNPIASRRYEARTGGSTGTPRRVLVGLDLVEHESAYHSLFYAAAGASDRAVAIWHPAPPGAVGIKTALIQARLGQPAERWFSQSRLRGGSLRHSAFTRAAIITAGLCGSRIPSPEHTRPQDASRVAAWLASKRAEGAPGILVTTASGGVRACAAAIDGGLDIAGTLLVLVGEPFTVEKAAVVNATGSRAASHYAMVEAGLIGLACQESEAPDDVHLLGDKVATIQRGKLVGANGASVGALFHTTLLPVSPKLMLNVESGDYGVRAETNCGCGALPEAFRSHLHTIRSYEKLTSEGMSFLGTDLLTLVEDVLPSRFGGHPTDYQLLEREKAGIPKVSLVVSPAIGDLDRDEVGRAVLEFLRDRGLAERMMSDLLAESRTLEVVRSDPRPTPGGKIPPLRLLNG
jgi:hypothetical protein